MNKNGATVGAYVMVVMAIIVGTTLLIATAQEKSVLTDLGNAVNLTMTFPVGTNTSELTMCGQRALTTAIINSSNGVVVPTTNYTVTQSVGADGLLTAKVTGTVGSVFAAQTVKVSCSYEPKGYATEASTRTIANLIVLFGALMVFAGVMYYFRDNFKEVLDSFK